MPQFKSNEIYQLEMYVRNANHAMAYCDLLVLDSANTIYAANLIATETKMKELTFLMQEGRTGVIHRAEGPHFEYGHERHNVYALSDRKAMYDEETAKIDDLTQTFMISKAFKPDLKARNEWLLRQRELVAAGYNRQAVPADLAELIMAWDGDYRQQIYDVLNDRYNTPMLPEWKDHIVDEMISQGFYEELIVKCYGSDYTLEAGLLRVTEEDLEEIITEAIQGMEFEFAIEEDGRTPDEGILNDLTSIDDYLTEFAGPLGKRIQENIALRFDPDKDEHHPAFHDINLHANQNGLTGLYPPQANTVMGIANTLVEDHYCFLIGEMG
jgi:hypothetical protein